MFSFPLLLCPFMLPLLACFWDLSTNMCTCTFGFCANATEQAKKEEEGVLKNNRNGRHWETPNQVLTSIKRWKQSKLGFLHVPTPTALKYMHICLWFLNQSYRISQKEEEWVHKNGRNGRHQESTKPNISSSQHNIRGGNKQVGRSSMFPFPVLLSSLFLPLPGMLLVPTNLRKQNSQTSQNCSYVHLVSALKQLSKPKGRGRSA
jgi:hypothetical protein